ncbi:MAG: guanylate kinase [Bacteroidetes bacterium]|nr:guanylate kinase [Bacteroidota bacterium]
MSKRKFTRVLIPPKRILVICSPSGAGKSSIVRKLLRFFPELSFSVSCTTRELRDGEVNGQHYYFLTVEEFKNKISKNEFAEFEEVYPGKFYGTLKSEVERIWNEHQVAVFDIDVKGALNIKQQFGKDCLTIYIAPPSKETLVQRLKSRGSEDAKSLKERIKRFDEEMSYATKFDSVVVNKDFDTAYMRVKNLVINFLEPDTIHVY